MNSTIFKHFASTLVIAFSISSIALAQQTPRVSSGELNASNASRLVEAKTNQEFLRLISQKATKRFDSLRTLALNIADEKGWTTSRRFEDGTVIELIGVTSTGKPLYYKTDNVDAAKTTSTDRVQPGGDLGLNLSGDGMMIGVWEGGDPLITHDEFNTSGSSPITDMDGFWQLSNHATHVSGTLIAGGAEPDALGMASNAEIHSYDWFDDISEVADAAADGMLVSNHSYGFITGWQYFSATDEWVWYGDPFYSEVEDYRFGFYSFESAILDDIAYNAPYYLYVKSAGNDRGDWDGFSEIPPDGGEEGYDCIGGQGNAKNVLTVGAIQDIPNGYNSVSDVVDASFSSMGPTDDGRIKPDIMGNGIGVYSSLAGDESDYASWNGTSMAAPNVSGSLILLQEHYENLHAEYMRSATLKALIIATADESGPHPGPDFKFGWGVLNTASAANVITNMGQESLVQEETYSSAPITFTVTASGNEPLTATIVWTDPAGDIPNAGLDPTDVILVNDLNLTVSSNGVTNFPYKLSASNPSAAATTGVNSVDNVEKVLVENPIAGAEYTIEISHLGMIAGANQDFSLVVTGLSSSITDLRLAQVYGLSHTGQSSGNLSPRYYAEIVNSGSFGTEAGTIELTSSGVNSGLATSSFVALNPTDTTMATITGYHPQNLGESEIVLSLPEDDFEGNNSGILVQETTEGTYSYYDSGVPPVNTVGFGTGEGALLAKFPVSGSRTLTEVSVYLLSETGNTIRPVVMDTLGNILAHGEEYVIQSTDINQWVTLPLSTNSDVTDAMVYAGIEAYEGPGEWYPIGFQEEIPAHPDAYYSGAIGGGEPVFGPYRQLGKWMIELTTCKILPDDVSLSGPETLCEGDVANYTVEFDGDSNVEWTIPEGWEAEIDGNSITVTPNGSSGSVLVAAVNECSSGEPQSIEVAVLPTQESSLDVSLCQGESYTFPDGTTEENIQNDLSHISALESMMGCDSMVVTEIMIYTIDEGAESVNICFGESVTFPDGSSENNIQADFSYTSIIESSVGCDSTVVTNVELYDVEDGSESIAICVGESVTFPDGTTQEDIQSDFSYTSELQSIQGCDSTVVSEVEVISIDDNSIEQEGNVLIAPDNMAAYSWLLCEDGNTEELGVSGMTFSPETDGSYAVTVTNSIGCTDTSPCYSFMLSSVDGASGKSIVTVFPNPSTGELNVSGMPVSRYQLFDISGRLVEDGLISSPSNEVKLVFSEMPASLYLLRLFTEQGYKDVRVVFE